MAQVPGVLNTRVDVGGANATTMQAYRAYGLDGGRGEIEGINSSQFGSGGLLGYSDMEAFDDMAINTTGNSAETPVPGAFVNVVSKAAATPTAAPPTSTTSRTASGRPTSTTTYSRVA